ncbi:Uma2 family endonuclease, partial [Arthrospira platensis FACHB-439]|nr:Uma2 family endonuclease [Arthrospira platensis FACHB-439]
LQVSGKIIDFYREDNGQKLLIPDELYAALQEATLARIEAEQRAETEKQRADELAALLNQYRQQFGDLG